MTIRTMLRSIESSQPVRIEPTTAIDWEQFSYRNIYDYCRWHHSSLSQESETSILVISLCHSIRNLWDKTVRFLSNASIFSSIVFVFGPFVFFFFSVGDVASVCSEATKPQHYFQIRYCLDEVEPEIKMYKWFTLNSDWQHLGMHFLLFLAIHSLTNTKQTAHGRIQLFACFRFQKEKIFFLFVSEIVRI